MKIGIIGFGNMGGALISGMLKAGFIMPANVAVCDIDSGKMEEASSGFGVLTFDKPISLCEWADFVVVAIKPQDVDCLISDIKDKIDNDKKILISIAAGIPVSAFRKYLKSIGIVRAMPNIPVLVGEGASGLYFDGEFPDADKKAVVRMFESFGETAVVSKEELLDTVTGLSGSGPAYVFAFINSLADGGVLEGLPREVSRKLAVQTVLGAAKLAKQSLDDNIHPEDLKDRVTSPGGTTAEGLLALEKGGFRATVIDAVSKATNKARLLGGNK
jgi:pyrroline-5-carboxylate reductase